MANNPEWSEILRESVTVKLPEGRLVRYGLACVWPSAGTGSSGKRYGRSGSGRGPYAGKPVSD